MTVSENRTDAPGADTAEKPRSAEDPAAAEPSGVLKQARAESGEGAPPEPVGVVGGPAGPSDADPVDLKERLLRVLAEQQNFRRRLERERDDAVRFAATQLVKELLQTADNLSRALQSATPDLPVRTRLCGTW
jgi:molecular chaperone GrpE